MDSNLFTNLEAEQSVLGSILIDDNIINIVSKRLDVEAFYVDAHKVIYESMIALYNTNSNIDLITLSDKLKNNGYLDAIGGTAYLSSLTTIVPTTNNINYYINILLEKYTCRKVLDNLEKIHNELSNSKLDLVKEEVDNLRNILINNKSIENMYIDVSEVEKNKRSEEFISTGFEELNKMLGGGFRITSLTILTGEPGAGKSTIINQIIAGAIQDGFRSFLYSGELPASDLIFWFNRTVVEEKHLEEKSNKKGIPYIDISDYCWNLIGKWAKGKFKIYGDDSEATKENILTVIENLAINHGIKLFVLDNLMTFDIGDAKEQYNQQKQLCLSLKKIAKKYSLAIILIAHPKKPEKGQKPSMYDVSGASEIVGSADTVIRIERPEAGSDDTSKLKLLKNRWGSIVGTQIRLEFDEYRKRFYTNQQELNRDYGYNETTVQENFIQPKKNKIRYLDFTHVSDDISPF